MARLDNRVLLDFLEEVDKELERKVTLIAVGGTALTLLGVFGCDSQHRGLLTNLGYVVDEKLLEVGTHSVK